MRRIWQAAAMLGTLVSMLAAQEVVQPFAWEAPKVVASIFTRDLVMLDSERDEYATNLATMAINNVVAAKASPASLTNARRMIALALQLSPRNKRAVIANFQLSKGVLPDPIESNYSQSVFARLLLTRGQLLEKQESPENQRLARYFIQLAAEMDPKNEDAVYASEVQRLDHGAVDWASVTDPTAKKE
jgi:hypothetical protein